MSRNLGSATTLHWIFQHPQMLGVFSTTSGANLSVVQTLYIYRSMTVFNAAQFTASAKRGYILANLLVTG